MKIAIIGATGLVGSKMIRVLEEFNIVPQELLLVGSSNSKGEKIEVYNQEIEVCLIEEALNKKPDFALFSAGASISRQWAEHFANAGTIVIDNSSAWRMHQNNKLIIPEINGKLLTKEDRIIANPNCSTIQLVMAIYPLHCQYVIKRLVVSTYQSVTGSGKQGFEQLIEERKNIFNYQAYKDGIDMNCIPKCGSFSPQQYDYTTEEMKLVNESKKILNNSELQITATAVRVPVIGGHSESVNIEFENDFDIKEVKNLLANFEGVELIDNVNSNLYPMPLMVKGKNEVFVGRVRRDYSINKGLNMWIVSDNLRKGAATNAVQIMKYLIEN